MLGLELPNVNFSSKCWVSVSLKSLTLLICWASLLLLLLPLGQPTVVIVQAHGLLLVVSVPVRHAARHRATGPTKYTRHRTGRATARVRGARARRLVSPLTTCTRLAARCPASHAKRHPALKHSKQAVVPSRGLQRWPLGFTVSLLMLSRPGVGQCCWPRPLLFCCYR